MSSATGSFQLPDYGQVHTLHVLKSGEIITTLAEFEPVEHRFQWVDRKAIIQRILYLRTVTDNAKKSVIVIYEDGQLVRELVNVEREFVPFLLKSAV
ncbi:MAG TPA: hypothetical protein VKR32_09910 [Puia sp.]|nr:hypothetical protein [Puia sp.]